MTQCLVRHGPLSVALCCYVLTVVVPGPVGPPPGPLVPGPAPAPCPLWPPRRGTIAALAALASSCWALPSAESRGAGLHLRGGH